MSAVFTQSQLEAIAAALGHTEEGLSGSEIGHLLQSSRLNDPSPDLTKRHRLYNAFAEYQNRSQERINILAFIRMAMKPERFSRVPEKFEHMRANLNQALAFAGLAVDASGTLISVDQAKTLTDARRRANELRADLLARSVHPDVVAFCREELLTDDYFHAVLEATKNVANKIRSRTGLIDDGAVLVDRALGGDLPMLAINSLQTKSEKDEQKGFATLVKGIFGMLARRKDSFVNA